MLWVSGLAGVQQKAALWAVLEARIVVNIVAQEGGSIAADMQAAALAAAHTVGDKAAGLVAGGIGGGMVAADIGEDARAALAVDKVRFGAFAAVVGGAVLGAFVWEGFAADKLAPAGMREGAGLGAVGGNIAGAAALGALAGRMLAAGAAVARLAGAAGVLGKLGAVAAGAFDMGKADWFGAGIAGAEPWGALDSGLAYIATGGGKAASAAMLRALRWRALLLRVIAAVAWRELPALQGLPLWAWRMLRGKEFFAEDK